MLFHSREQGRVHSELKAMFAMTGEPLLSVLRSDG